MNETFASSGCSLPLPKAGGFDEKGKSYDIHQKGVTLLLRLQKGFGKGGSRHEVP